MNLDYPARMDSDRLWKVDFHSTDRVELWPGS